MTVTKETKELLGNVKYKIDGNILLIYDDLPMETILKWDGSAVIEGTTGIKSQIEISGALLVGEIGASSIVKVGNTLNVEGEICNGCEVTAKNDIIAKRIGVVEKVTSEHGNVTCPIIHKGCRVKRSPVFAPNGKITDGMGNKPLPNLTI